MLKHVSYRRSRIRALKDIDVLMENPPSIVDFIVMLEKNTAIKKTMKMAVKFRSLINGLESILRNVKLTISWNGITVKPMKVAV